MIQKGANPLWKPMMGAQLDRSHSATQGLQACWLFNENSGNMLYDLAGNYHFALTGTVARVAEPYGPAIKFDGVTGQGIAPAHPLAGSTAFTILFRVRQKDGLASPYGSYLGSEQGFISGVNLNSNFPSQVEFDISNSKILTNIPNDAWVHLAFQWSNATGIQRVYTNSIQTANNTGLSIGALPAYTNAYIGKASAAQSNYTTDSQVSYMKVYNRFLSAPEIAADYETPYALFRPANDRVYFYGGAPLPPAGGGMRSNLTLNPSGMIGI